MARLLIHRPLLSSFRDRVVDTVIMPTLTVLGALFLCSVLLIFSPLFVTTYVVRLKLFRLKAEGVTHASPPATQGKEKHDSSTLAEDDFVSNVDLKYAFP